MMRDKVGCDYRLLRHASAHRASRLGKLRAAAGGLHRITDCYILDLVKLISNKALREFASLYPDSGAPLQAFRVRVEKGVYRNFAELKATFRGVDKVGERYVFNVGGNKYRVIAGIAFSVQIIWVKAVLTHARYDEGDWK